MKLCLFTDDNAASVEYPMTRSGDHWHIEVVGLRKSGALYGLRVSGQGGWETGYRWNDKVVLLDPYAPLVSGRRVFGVRDEVEQFKYVVRALLRLSLSLSLSLYSTLKQVSNSFVE